LAFNISIRREHGFRNLLPMIADRIYKLHEQLADQSPRHHLGASEIGHKCERALWYSFRWAFKKNFSGRMLRLFETGNLAETRLIKELRLAGFEVVDRDDGHQLRFKEHGHFAGSIDGKILIDGEWYLLEIKTSNLKGFTYLKENGVKKSQGKHYAQMQTYMRTMGLTKALYVSICKDNEEIYSEVVNYNEKESLKLSEKALRVIQSEDVPPRISDTIKGCFECEWCDYVSNCHRLNSDQLPEFNCRTCLNSTPIANGEWLCNQDRKEIKELKGCSEHLFIPALVPGEFLGADDSKEFKLEFRTIEGKTIINRKGKGLEIIA